MARKGLPGQNWTTDYDFSSMGGPKPGAKGSVRWALSKGYNPYTGAKTTQSFKSILAAKRKKDAEDEKKKKDPYGVEDAITKYNTRQDKDSAAHQAWSKEVSSGLENWLGTSQNIRGDLTQRYEKQAKDLAAPTGLTANAPQVGGSAGTVLNPNQAATTASLNTHAGQTSALSKLSQLQGSSAWLNGEELANAGMKEFKYKQSQIPKIYNDAKNKYESELRKAVRDIEAKKELAMIQAQASMYGNELSLLGSLSGQQAQNQRALLDSQTDIYKTDQNNATDIEIADRNNVARASLERWKAQWKSLQGDPKREDKAWSSFLNGQQVEDPSTATEQFYRGGEEGNGLLPGAWIGAKEKFVNGSNQEQVMAGVQWLQSAAYELYPNDPNAADKAAQKLKKFLNKNQIDAAVRKFRELES